MLLFVNTCCIHCLSVLWEITAQSINSLSAVIFLFVLLSCCCRSGRVSTDSLHANTSHHLFCIFKQQHVGFLWWALWPTNHTFSFFKKTGDEGSFHNPLKRAVKHGSRICRLSVSSESSRGRRGRLFASALVFSASKTKKPPVGWKKKEKEKVTMQDHNTHLNKFCFLQPHNNKKNPSSHKPGWISALASAPFSKLVIDFKREINGGLFVASSFEMRCI